MTDSDTPHVVIGDPDPFGRIRLEWNDFVLILHMNWQAIKAMQTEWGVFEYSDAAAKGLDAGDVDTLGKLFGFSATVEGEREPIGYERIMSIGFPIPYARQACVIAWQYAWRGGEIFDTEEEASDDGKKPMNPLATSLGWLSKLLSESESHSPNSGEQPLTRPES